MVVYEGGKVFEANVVDLENEGTKLVVFRVDHPSPTSVPWLDTDPKNPVKIWSEKMPEGQPIIATGRKVAVSLEEALSHFRYTHRKPTQLQTYEAFVMEHVGDVRVGGHHVPHQVSRLWILMFIQHCK